MSVTLVAIKFNHDSTGATTDALNLRRNATQFVTVPEWQSGVSVNPEDSPAAYSIDDTRGNTITIQARFHTDEPISVAEIRAIDPVVDPPGPAGCLGWLYKLIRALIRAISGNVLGDVRPAMVTFSGTGDTGFATFQLQNLRLWDVGVGVRTTTWTWQYRVGGGPWTDIATTSHRIYSVLKVPTAPWQQTPYNAANTQLPWTEVLDVACQWAVLAQDPVQAGTRVTERIYALGPATFVYDCPGGGDTHYTDFSTTFYCTAFLERLKGGPGFGEFVNCTDCATFVSTFSNALGCDLWQSKMGWGFALNPLLAIGSNVWQTACGWGGFSYHEVAWTGACDVDDRVYDACLQVDGDADPAAAPHTPLLPVDMRFGNPGDMDYRSRLCPPAGQPDCDPQPAEKRRRLVA